MRPVPRAASAVGEQTANFIGRPGGGMLHRGYWLFHESHFEESRCHVLALWREFHNEYSFLGFEVREVECECLWFAHIGRIDDSHFLAVDLYAGIAPIVTTADDLEFLYCLAVGAHVIGEPSALFCHSPVASVEVTVANSLHLDKVVALRLLFATNDLVDSSLLDGLALSFCSCYLLLLCLPVLL